MASPFPPTQRLIDFKARSELLGYVLSTEQERYSKLDEVSQVMAQSVAATAAMLKSTSNQRRSSSASPDRRSTNSSSAVLSVSPLSSSGVSPISAIQALQQEIGATRRRNETVKRDVVLLHQRSIRLQHELDGAVARRASVESGRQTLSQLTSQLQRLLRYWEELQSKLTETSEKGFVDPMRGLEENPDSELERAVLDSERHLAELKLQEHSLKKELDDATRESKDRDREIATLKNQCERAKGQGVRELESIEVDKRRLLSEIEDLHEKVGAARRQQQRFLNAYTAKFIAATMFPPRDRLPAQMEQRIAALKDQLEDGTRMTEAMALLKSTIVHFETDMKRLRSVQRLAEGELENVFKVSHNEVKVVLSLILPKEDIRRFSRGGHTFEEWPLTQAMLEERFPQHKLETLNNALQDMVMAWDGMSEAAKARMTTAQDVVANAHLLFMIACYVSLKRAQKWALKYQQVMDVRLPKVALM